jgi:hypothetical protein
VQQERRYNKMCEVRIVVFKSFELVPLNESRVSISYSSYKSDRFTSSYLFLLRAPKHQTYQQHSLSEYNNPSTCKGKCHSGNTKFQNRVYDFPLPIPPLNCIRSLHNLTKHFFQIHLNILFPIKPSPSNCLFP